MEVCVARLRGDGAFRAGDTQLIESLPSLPAAHLALLDGPVTVCLISHNPNGSVHHSPVWLGRDDNHLYLTSIRGRPHDRNLRDRPDVSLLFVDPADPYSRMTVTGVVDDVLDEDQHNGSAAFGELIEQLRLSGCNGVFDPVPVSDTRALHRIRPVRLMLYER